MGYGTWSREDGRSSYEEREEERRKTKAAQEALEPTAEERVVRRHRLEDEAKARPHRLGSGRLEVTWGDVLSGTLQVPGRADAGAYRDLELEVVEEGMALREILAAVEADGGDFARWFLFNHREALPKVRGVTWMGVGGIPKKFEPCGKITLPVNFWGVELPEPRLM